MPNAPPAEPSPDGDPQRGAQWQQLEGALALDRQAQRSALLQAMAEPAVGHCLLLLTRWLELECLEMAQAAPGKSRHKQPDAGPWLRKRLAKLAEALRATQGLHGQDAASQHRLRILSKRLRYGVEDLRGLLPKKRATRWLDLATQIQTDIGLARDRQLAFASAERLGAARSILDYLSHQ